MLLKKGVYPYINEWEKFNKTSLSEKEELHSDLKMEDIADEDYMHAKRFWKEFEIEGFGE